MEAASLIDPWDPRDPDLYVTLAGAAVASMIVEEMIRMMTDVATSVASACPASLVRLMTMTGKSNLSPTVGAYLDDSLTLGFLPFLF